MLLQDCLFRFMVAYNMMDESSSILLLFSALSIQFRPIFCCCFAKGWSRPKRRCQPMSRPTSGKIRKLWSDGVKPAAIASHNRGFDESTKWGNRRWGLGWRGKNGETGNKKRQAEITTKRGATFYVRVWREREKVRTRISKTTGIPPGV